MLVKLPHKSFGTEIRKAKGCFHCIGQQAHTGTGKTREAAMVAYANRKVMNEDEFLESNCAMVG